MVLIFNIAEDSHPGPSSSKSFAKTIRNELDGKNNPEISPLISRTSFFCQGKNMPVYVIWRKI
jgi:hypothetical protein